jgi:hypothetical protein
MAQASGQAAAIRRQYGDLECELIPLSAVAEMPREKTTQFNMRMRPRFKEMVEKAAAADHRTLASLIEKLLADYCQQHGFREEASKKERRS